MALENSNDDLEMLKQRYLQRLQADSITADNAPQRSLGMGLATGLLDLGERMNAGSTRQAEILSGAKPGSLGVSPGPQNNQAKYIQGIKDQQTAARQQALSDIQPISTIQAMIDKRDKEKEAALNRSQDLQMKGYTLGAPGSPLTMIPGGAAEADIANKKAQALQRESMSDYYDTGKSNQMDFTKNTQMEKQANMIHAKVVSKLQSDPVLKTKLNQLNNLSAAMNNFDNADHPTPQSFDELQQAVRANLGIKGSSAVGEREHTTMNSLGLNGARMMQFLTGNPQDIAKDAGFAKHIKDLVKLEQRNIKTQTQKHLDTLTAGHASMYKKFPDLKSDLEDVSGAYGNEFSSPVGLPSGGVRMKDPAGIIRIVPSDQVDAAKANGGQVL